MRRGRDIIHLPSGELSASKFRPAGTRLTARKRARARRRRRNICPAAAAADKVRDHKRCIKNDRMQRRNGTRRFHRANNARPPSPLSSPPAPPPPGEGERKEDGTNRHESVLTRPEKDVACAASMRRSPAHLVTRLTNRTAEPRCARTLTVPNINAVSARLSRRGRRHRDEEKRSRGQGGRGKGNGKI